VIQAPKHSGDERGSSWNYRADQFKALGLPPTMFKTTIRAQKDVLRGLHFQYDPPMSKLMRVTVGRAFLVAVD
jgi:dTDP-4-dehydrorhamnose 3,5-epimerase